ncbi:hypothetical protein [Psychrobacter sp. I-STPA6b]|uniref:hypothetical protein n=1 Tax=Psychrobacter sp. I-STPA6b TaxID=2585718 RepID=UPI001D0C319E|nr:hypothetical protein [Psychrobacter sp. I-STPA6b]
MVKTSFTLAPLSNKLTLIGFIMVLLFGLSACTSSLTKADNQNPDSSVKITENLEKTPKSTLESTTENAEYSGCYTPSNKPPTAMVQQCQQQGGSLQVGGMLGCYQCVVEYADAGKTCQDSSECQGTCRNTEQYIEAGLSNQTGQCSANSSPFGCYQVIEKGVAQGMLCVD